MTDEEVLVLYLERAELENRTPIRLVLLARDWAVETDAPAPPEIAELVQMTRMLRRHMIGRAKAGEGECRAVN